jgi:hypothetical protein
MTSGAAGECQAYPVLQAALAAALGSQAECDYRSCEDRPGCPTTFRRNGQPCAVERGIAGHDVRVTSASL